MYVEQVIHCNTKYYAVIKSGVIIYINTRRKNVKGLLARIIVLGTILISQVSVMFASFMISFSK